MGIGDSTKSQGPGSHRLGSTQTACGPGGQDHEFKNAKADGSELEGSFAARLCDNVQGAWWAERGSSAAVPAPTRRGQATSSMPANKELQLWPGPRLISGPPFGVSMQSRPCSDAAPWSLEPASLVSASLAAPGTGRGQLSGDVGGTGLGCSPDGGMLPLGENKAELRGCRKAWPPVKGRVSVSRSDGPTRAAAGLGSAGGLRAGGHCRQEASKCLRI